MPRPNPLFACRGFARMLAPKTRGSQHSCRPHYAALGLVPAELSPVRTQDCGNGEPRQDYRPPRPPLTGEHSRVRSSQRSRASGSLLPLSFQEHRARDCAGPVLAAGLRFAEGGPVARAGVRAAPETGRIRWSPLKDVRRFQRSLAPIIGTPRVAVGEAASAELHLQGAKHGK